MDVERGRRLGRLFFEKWFECGKQCVGDDLRTFGGGMNAVGLNGAWDSDQVFVDHWHDGGVVTGGEIDKDFVELLYIVGPVIRRQGNTGKQYFDVRVDERRKHQIEIVARLFKREPAKTIVAAEFDDDDGGMQQQDGVKTGNGVFCGGPAGAFVEDVVVVAELVKIALQVVGIGLTGHQAVTCRNAVAVAN